MNDILQTISTSPLLAYLGFAFMLLLLLIPIALKLAGLTGQQIADVLAMTWQMLIQLVQALRAENKASGSSPKNGKPD